MGFIQGHIALTLSLTSRAASDSLQDDETLSHVPLPLPRHSCSWPSSLSYEPVVLWLCQMEESEDKCGVGTHQRLPRPSPDGAGHKEGETSVPSMGMQCPERWPVCPVLQLGSGPLIWKSP